jgi:hypothetical protein
MKHSAVRNRLSGIFTYKNYEARMAVILALQIPVNSYVILRYYCDHVFEIN